MQPQPTPAAQRLQAYIHNWVKVEPRKGLRHTTALGQPVLPYRTPRRLPVRNGHKVHAAKIRRGEPVWVCVITVDSYAMHGGNSDCLVVFVDHEDHELIPGYEYAIWLSEINVLESKRPL